MNVVQVTHKYQPSIGGVENYAARLNGSLRERGHSASTITTDASFTDGRCPSGEREGVTYCETEASFYRNPLSIELYRQVKASTADVYHLHGLRFLPTLEAVHALPEATPTVLTIHGVRGPHNTLLDRLVHAAYAPFAQYVLDAMDHVIVLGADEKRWLTEQFDISSAAVSVVPNGIHTERYDVPSSAVDAFCAEHGIDRSTPTVLCVTRLVPLKRPDALVEAVSAHLPDVDMEVVLVGTGDDSYVEELRQRADDRVRFLSNLSFEGLKAAYHAADVYACTSTFEGLPTVILEAMNAQLPVVSTPVGAIPDAVREPENGLLVSSPPDARSLGTALRYYLDQPDVRVAVGDRNRERVRAAYEWDDIAGSIIDVYEGVRR
jgi:glycosyltransferase involved in cell wall biosynthesis